jgi:hypothetical protein
LALAKAKILDREALNISLCFMMALMGIKKTPKARKHCLFQGTDRAYSYIEKKKSG